MPEQEPCAMKLRASGHGERHWHDHKLIGALKNSAVGDAQPEICVE